MRRQKDSSQAGFHKRYKTLNVKIILGADSPRTTHIAFASFIGTAIEFYDFYIYGLAAAINVLAVFIMRETRDKELA